MALAHQSIMTFDKPQFINLTPDEVNPLMSKCEIKVFYLGKSRNKTYVDKATALEMAKSLRGAPIVGYFKEDKQDFSTHGDQIIIDDDGYRFNSLTRPYGFVATDAKVWFQKFKETDDFGNPVQREYMMTTGYLWTGQYPEANQVYENNGKPHSMELDEETLEGHWTTQNNSNMEFFIISNAVFSKLCILGQDVEPCYEGSGVTKPEVSTYFTKNLDNKFMQLFFTMMKELQETVKGEKNMADIEKTPNAAVAEGAEEPETKAALAEQTPIEGDAAAVESAVEPETKSELTGSETEEAPATEFKQDKEEKKEEEAKEEDKKEEEESKEEDKKDDKEEEKKPASKNELGEDYEAKFNELQTKFAELQTAYNSLMEFKAEIENKEKDTLINSFFMLSDEDKQEVIDHKTEYTLEEIKSKLAVKCFDKKVNFNLDSFEKTDNKVEEKNTAVTFNLNDDNSSLSDWVKEVKAVEKSGI